MAPGASKGRPNVRINDRAPLTVLGARQPATSATDADANPLRTTRTSPASPLGSTRETAPNLNVALVKDIVPGSGFVEEDGALGVPASSTSMASSSSKSLTIGSTGKNRTMEERRDPEGPELVVVKDLRPGLNRRDRAISLFVGQGTASCFSPPMTASLGLSFGRATGPRPAPSK